MRTCNWCGEPLDAQGIRYHEECLIRELMGSAAHQLGLCAHFGGDAPEDPPEATKREAARLAWELWWSERDDIGRPN